MSLDAIDVASALMRHASVTPESAGVFDTLEGFLKPLGFTCHREIFEEPGHEPVENMYARFGSSGRNFCFAGHTDVVPVGNEAAWNSPPFEPTIKDGKLYGRGAEDMKGAVGSFVAAASRFVAEAPANVSLSLLITNDEEGYAINGTRKMLQWMEKQGERMDACIVGEPTNPTFLGEMGKIGRRGSLVCKLLVKGRQGHVAYPDLADNPVTKLVHMMHALKANAIDEGTDFFPPSNLEVTSIDVGNAASNLIPADATARFNIRFNNLHSGESMRLWVRSVLDGISTDYELDAFISGESFLTEDEELAGVVVGAVEAVTGKRPKLTTTGGTSDARFIKDYCPVMEFGATGHTPHMVNECVAVDDLHKLADIYYEMIKRYHSGS